MKRSSAALLLSLPLAVACATTIADPDPRLEPTATEELPRTVPPALLAGPRTWGEAQRLSASDKIAAGLFGRSVAMSGNTAIVGASGATAIDAGVTLREGAAYVFVRTGNTWTEQARLVAPDKFESIGTVVAISGDTAIASTSVSVLVFTRTGTTWTSTAKLNVPGGSDGEFGRSIAISGDTIVIGAATTDGGSDAGLDSAGAAYVFTRGAGSWSLQQRLTPTDELTNARFGTAVSISGDTVLVGSPQADHAAAGNPYGAAYVFTRSGASWTQQQKLTAVNPTAGDKFGDAVAIAGDHAVVGAPGLPAKPGRAFAFSRTGTSWTGQELISAAQKKTDVGFSVAASTDTLAVASLTTGLGGFLQTHLFQRPKDVWSEQATLVSAQRAVDVSLSPHVLTTEGDTLMLGAQEADVAGVDRAGEVYVYTLAERLADGGVASGDGGVSDNSSSSGTSGTGNPAGGESDDSGGCGCRVGATPRSDAGRWSLVGFAVAAVGLRIRRRAR